MPKSKAFLKSLDLALLIKSWIPEESEIALNLCTFLIHHDHELQMSDLIGLDLVSRDILDKNATIKFWQALNTMDDQIRAN